GHFLFDFTESIEQMAYDVEGELSGWDVGSLMGGGVDAGIEDAHVLVTGGGISAQTVEAEMELWLKNYSVKHRTERIFG
ncbi:MAG: hypothetical protein RIS28_59, partial [Bacteroidota bacterium]